MFRGEPLVVSGLSERLATTPEPLNLLTVPLLCCSLQRVQKKSTASQTHCCGVIPAGDQERVKSHAACTRKTHVTKSACVLQAPASKHTSASILQEPAEVVQVYRYPGLSKSAAAALLRKVTPVATSVLDLFATLHTASANHCCCQQVQQTVSSEIVAVDAELVSCILLYALGVRSLRLVQNLTYMLLDAVLQYCIQLSLNG